MFKIFIYAKYVAGLN